MQNEPCIRMYCESEGRCHGIVLVYFNDGQKNRVLTTTDEMAHRHRVAPDVSVRNRGDYGEVFIEFYDEYHHEGACFFEELVEALGAKLCDCEDL